MRKVVGVLVLLMLSCTAVTAQGFAKLGFKGISGDSISLNSYTGRKVMVYILPLSESDPAFTQLQLFKKRYLDSVTIIGVLSVEDGYQSKSVQTIQGMYKNMGIVLTQGMYTKRASGANQSPMMKWLTDKGGNGHFDIESVGVGHKFFVTPGGRLFAVMPAQTSLQSGIIDKIVHSPNGPVSPKGSRVK